MANAQELKPLWKHSAGEYITAIEWSPDGTCFAAAQAEGPILLLSERGKVLRELPGHAMGTNALAWSPDGDVLATGGQDKKARLLNPKSGETVAEFLPGGASVEKFTWQPGSPILASASGKHLRLWDAKGQPAGEFPDQKFSIADMQWRTDGKYLATANFEGVRLWEPGVATAMLTYENQLPILALAWNATHEWIVCGTQEASLLIWNTKSGEDFQAGPYMTKVRELSWDYRGRYLVTGGGVDLSLWDFNKDNLQGLRPTFLRGHKDPVSQVHFQHVGPTLASAGKDGMAFFWKPEISKDPIATCPGREEVSKIAWHPKDRSLAIARADGAIELWPTPGRA
ncbi:PD40 domain-containing protein [soil metagenome]